MVTFLGCHLQSAWRGPGENVRTRPGRVKCEIQRYVCPRTLAARDIELVLNHTVGSWETFSLGWLGVAIKGL